MLKRFVIGIVWFCSIGLCYSTEPEHGDYAKFQGRWVVVRCERDGATIPDRNGHAFTYEGATVRLDAETGGEKYVLQENTTPKTIDFLDEHDPPVLGIYKFEGDRLVICTADPGSKRPTDFTTASGDGRTLTEMRREKQ